MASVSRLRGFLLAAAMVPFGALGAAGCGESFIAGGGGSGGGEACQAQETRECYSGPDGTVGKGQCKKGVETCSSEGTWPGTCKGEVTPAAEACDQLDNDCDGQVDNDCPCSPEDTQDCFGGVGMPGVGECKYGTQICSAAGAWGECNGAIGGTSEVCNGKDDDCDGTDDNNAEGSGMQCDVEGLEGECKKGISACQDGVLKCVQTVQSQTETCDGLDNDCSGKPDDGIPTGATCDTGMAGLCKAGVEACVGGAFSCVPTVQATGEVCNGKDDDCDGEVDDDPASVGDNCNFNAGAYECTGSYECSVNGTLVCIPTAKIETFSDAEGWTAGGEWEIGATSMGNQPPPTGNPDPQNDHSPGDDNQVAGVVLGGNANNLIHGPDYLTSPVYDTSGDGKRYLSFYRWLNTDGSGTMQDWIEVSSNGGSTWTIIWTNGQAGLYESAWTKQVYDVTAHKSANFRVRFGVKVSVISAIVTSWNIDDLVIGSCPPPN